MTTQPSRCPTVLSSKTNDEILSGIAQLLETGSLAYVSLYEALASGNGAQQLARCGKVAAGGHGHLCTRLQHEVVVINISGSERRQTATSALLRGRSEYHSRRHGGTRAQRKLANVHTELLGPIPQESYEGLHHEVGFIDSYSCFGAVCPSKSKGEVIAKLQQFFIKNCKPGTSVSDRAPKFKSKQFSDLSTSNVMEEFSTLFARQK